MKNYTSHDDLVNIKNRLIEILMDETTFKYREDNEYVHNGVAVDDYGHVNYTPNLSYNVGICDCDDWYMCEHRAEYIATQIMKLPYIRDSHK